MKSLKLFNVVLADKNKSVQAQAPEALKLGLYITPRASHATSMIVNFYREQFLSGTQFNSTFHKSFGKVLSSTRAELFIHQMLHYITTYGFDAMGIYSNDTVYIPNEVLEIPEITDKVSLKVIDAVSEEQLEEKCFDLLGSGIALKQDTIMDVLDILKDTGYSWSNSDIKRIKNKEAKLMIIKMLGIMPTDPVDFVRYLVWAATGQTLLIKDRATIEAIIASGYDITNDVTMFGTANAAMVFNRFKPLFLAFKKASCNKVIVNKVSRLSKKYHVPMKEDILANITSDTTANLDKVEKALDRATNFRKVSILNAINNRMQGSAALMYRVRNGKSFVKDSVEVDRAHLFAAFNVVYTHLVNSLDVKGKTIKVSEGIKLAVPTSEKMFIGNLPTGTSVNLATDMIAGIYWENAWGASDLDLSGMSLNKIGWNSQFKNEAGTAIFSGDITNAHNGASEVFYVKKGLSHPMLMVNNIYSGEVGCKFKIFAGHEEPKNGALTSNYTVNPNNVLFQVDTEMDTKQQIVGIFIPEEDGTVTFVLVNTGFGNVSVSSKGDLLDKAKEFFVKSNARPLNLEKLLVDAGAIVSTEEGEIDLTVENLAKDTIINLIK